MNWKLSRNKSLMIGLIFKQTRFKHSQLTIIEFEKGLFAEGLNGNFHHNHLPGLKIA